MNSMLPVMDSLGTWVGAWLVTWTVHATLLLGGAWAAARGGLVRSMPWRDALWKIALAGSLVTATAQAGMGVRFLGGGVDIPMDPASSSENLHAPDGGPALFMFSESGRAPLAARANGSPADLLADALPWVAAAWAIVALALLARFGARHLRLARFLRHRQPVRDARALALLESLRRRAGIRFPVRLSVLDRLAGPVALAGGEICVPVRALDRLAPAELEAALAHELAHLARRDPAWLAAGGALAGLFFFHPLVRIARRELRDAAECLSDDWAVRVTGGRIHLARCLAEVATWSAAGRRAPMVAAMADEGSPLVRRVSRLLADDAPRATSLPRGLHALTVALVLAATVGFAPGVRRAPIAAPGLIAATEPAAAPGDALELRGPSVSGRAAGWDPLLHREAHRHSTRTTPRHAPTPAAPRRRPAAPAPVDRPAPVTGEDTAPAPDAFFLMPPEARLLRVIARPLVGVILDLPDAATLEALRLPAGAGAQVTGILAGTPAEAAGLRAGDVVTHADGRRVDSESLRALIAGGREGASLLLTVRRGDQLLPVPVTLDAPVAPAVLMVPRTARVPRAELDRLALEMDRLARELDRVAAPNADAAARLRLEALRARLEELRERVGGM